MSETESTFQAQLMSLATANNHLAVRLHQLLAGENENVFFSPFSISTAMVMVQCAAEGETEAEIRAAFGHDHAGLKRDEISQGLEQQISLIMKNSDFYTLCYANSVVSRKGFEVKEGYKQILAQSFKVLLYEVDFEGENEKAITDINEWVKEATSNMITELVKFLDPDAVIVLLNAVYFKGTWLWEFDKRQTFPQDFYNKGIEEKVKQVDMMNLTGIFSFYEDDFIKALELPYVGEEITMFILLPRENNGLESLEAALTSSFLQDIKNKLSKENVEVFFPKFRLEYTKSLIPCFQLLGVNRAFNRGAELSIASDSPDLAVSEILHKAVLEVNEEGSETSASSMFGLANYMSVPSFVADHPFVFFIYDTRSDLILFMGRVNEL